MYLWMIDMQANKWRGGDALRVGIVSTSRLEAWVGGKEKVCLLLKSSGPLLLWTLVSSLFNLPSHNAHQHLSRELPDLQPWPGLASLVLKLWLPSSWAEQLLDHPALQHRWPLWKLLSLVL